MLIRTGGYSYVFEFKFKNAAANAIKQMNERRYTEGYAVGNDKLVKVGVNFDMSTRTIENWEIE